MKHNCSRDTHHFTEHLTFRVHSSKDHKVVGFLNIVGDWGKGSPDEDNAV